MGSILVNAYTHQNLGDDLFLETLISKYPLKNFVIVGNEEKLSFLVKKDNVRIVDIMKASLLEKLLIKIKFLSPSRFKANKWGKFLQRNSGMFSCYLILGGSMFMERGNLDWTTSNLIVHKLTDSCKLIIGSNFGPFKSAAFYDFYKEYFKKFDLVIFRDSASKELFRDLKNIKYSTDFVFNLIDRWGNGIREKNSIGISVIQLDKREHLRGYKETYLNYLDNLIKRSIEQKRSCYLFSFCESEGDNFVVDHFSQKYKQVIPVYYKGDMDEFLKIYSKVETIVATRFHALVLSLLFNQKVFSVIYSDKTYNLIRDLEVAVEYSYIKDLDRHDISRLESLKQLDITNIKEKAGIYFTELDKYLS